MDSGVENPKVSVLTPIYNTKPEHLRECIESILNQTYKNFEFIILNDSPENMEIENIVKSYKDTRIKYFKNDRNIGITPSRNRLIELSQGEYLAIFDHDDISLPTRLEKQVKYLDENKYVGVVSGQLEFFPDKKKEKYHPENDIEIKISLMNSDVVHHTAIMLRRSIIDEYNIRYEKEYSPAEDYKLVLTLIKYTMFHNIQEVLVRYRWHNSNTSQVQRSKMTNGDMLCRCFAMKEYPYLYWKSKTNYTIRLFSIIPLLKVKTKPQQAAKTRTYLFGFIPLFTKNIKKF